MSFCIIVFIIWWYYRYRYRPRQVLVGQNRPVVTQGGPAIVADGDVNIIRVNAPHPAYPQAGPVTIMPNGSTVHYGAYPPPAHGPVQAYYPPPPAYSSVVKTGTTVTTTSFR